jgi:putative ABC transport system permease protein
VSRATPSRTDRSSEVGARLPVSPVPPVSQPASLGNMLHQFRGGKRGPFGALGANFGSAFEAIWANRTRSFLTTLGIFIGVAAVIAALTLTQGVSAYIEARIGELGTNIVLVYPGSTSNRGARGSGVSLSLTQEDADSLLKVPHISRSSSVSVISGVQLVFGNQNWTSDVNGVDLDFQDIRQWKLAQGRLFTPADTQQRASVVILGDTVAHNLFDASNTNPLGKTIRVRDQLFEVIGVLPASGISDDIIYVPLATSQARLKTTNSIDQIQIEVDARENIPGVKQEITAILRQNHRIPAGAADDFTLFDFTQFLQVAQQQTAIMTFLLVGIAAISLSVGGIGIMNIMLVSVTERTREIGIRMSIGARRADIRNQFLVEALTLCLIGAAIGLGLGLLVGSVVTSLAGLPFIVTAITIAIPIVVSVSITLIFGLYPAIQAARLDPVEALRIDE